MMDSIRVLISLYRGYGLGDGVQMSAVLQHLAKYRPHWLIDYRADEGRHQVARGLCANHFPYEESFPTSHYDSEVQIRLYDTWANWDDRPNTRVSSCLHEIFGLGWDPDCGRYHVKVRPELINPVHRLLRHSMCVGIHYEGDSAQESKNLTHKQADKVCQIVEQAGYEPIILDWRNRCPLHRRKLRSPQEWGGNAEMVCAVISQCRYFIGIDSGPSKCASATNTPSLVIWTGHHPSPFHDPAPNTTHLVPRGYHEMKPICNDSGVIKFFEKWYNAVEYQDIEAGVSQWIGL